MSAISLYDNPCSTLSVNTSRCVGESASTAFLTLDSASSARRLSSASNSVTASDGSTGTVALVLLSWRRRSSISRRSMVNSQVRSELSPRNESIDANALTNVSCTSSSISERSPELTANRASASEWRPTSIVAARESPVLQRSMSSRSESSLSCPEVIQFVMFDALRET